VALKVGILTGGGDAPGLNAVLRGVVKTLARRGHQVWGVLDAFEGLVEGRGRPLAYDDVSGILARGGTLLGTSNKGDAPRRLREGLANYRRWGLDGLVAVGGDGTLRHAYALSRLGARVVGVPKTIDNDVAATDVSFGFDSALSVAAGAVEALHSTAEAHGRIMVVEVMGRSAGWIALYAGLAGGGDVLLLPELGFDLRRVAAYVRERHRTRRYTVVVVAEGAASGADVARRLSRLTGIESRVTVLGHLQRAGSPTPADRLLGTRYGVGAAGLVLAGRWGRMVALKAGKLTSVPLASVAGKVRRVPKGHELLRAARAVGTCLGR
jgi:6-phosphofructokinase 1